MFRFGEFVEIYVFHERVSFHKQIDGLAAVVRQQMGRDPMSGAYFVFRSRSRHSARILYYHHEGYELLTRRLSRGMMADWPQGEQVSSVFASHVRNFIWQINSNNY